MKQIFLLFLLIILTSISCFGQKIKNVSISTFNESISFPFTRFLPMHPGVEIDVNLKRTVSDKMIRDFNIGVGYYYHEKLENALFLRGDYVWRAKIKSLLTIDAMTTLAYHHAFFPGEVYHLNESGEPVKKNQLGRGHAMLGIGVGATFRLGRVEPFIRQEMMLVTPFAKVIPVIPHSFLKIGLNISLDKNDK